MRRLALLLPCLLWACSSDPDGGERAVRAQQRFTSAEAVLVDFDIDGAIRADTDDDATLRTLIGAQLMYSVGALNADRSVGRHERLVITSIARAANGDVTYHAKLPVAWGQPTAVPSSYELTLPARVTEADQTAFAAKYGNTCVDSEAAGAEPMHASRMFLFYRPRRVGCVLGAEDVVTMSAKVTPSNENTTGKYPEYDRVWDDGALRVVALFSRADAFDKTGTDDEGVHASYEFMVRAQEHVKKLGAASISSGGGAEGWALTATLADGRKVVVDARLVGHELAKEDASFDTWYDARTPEADLIVYSGHAGLGWNVRTLMSKGTFRAGKYLVWAVNGCDTFAYVDRTLANRRAALNADDAAGTKYLDVVSNVMAGYFDTGPETTVTLIDALVGANKTYRDIFVSIDPGQVIAVTGEEDNVFQPKPSATPSSTEPVQGPGVVTTGGDGAARRVEATSDDKAEEARVRGCSAAAGRTPSPGIGGAGAFIAACAAIAARRRWRRNCSAAR